MSDLRVDCSNAEDLYERLDGLVDEDPVKLRDLALDMARDVEVLKGRIAELEAHPAMLVDPGAEARGYAKAVARLLDSDAYLTWYQSTRETPFPALLTTRRQHQDIARFLEAEATKDQP